MPIPAEVTTVTPMENLTTVVGDIWDLVSNGLTTITSQPILLVGLGIFVVGAVIGLVYRMIRG